MIRVDFLRVLEDIVGSGKGDVLVGGVVRDSGYSRYVFRDKRDELYCVVALKTSEGYRNVRVDLKDV